MWFLLASARAAELLPPELAVDVPPAYPAEALARGEPATVELELEIGADGRVRAATVVGPASPAFDAAALQAARNLVFRPATEDGVPVPVTIRWRTVFEPAQAPPISLEGRVRAAGTREPLAGFDLAIRAGEREVIAITGPDGAFAVPGLADGTWTVAAIEPGWRSDPAAVAIAAGQVAEVALWPRLDRPWEREDGVAEEIVVVGESVAPEVTQRTLTREEARYLPGSNGDLVKVVQNLPGVARPPLGVGQLVIRGTAPEDSAYYLDGSQLPVVFHFAGFSTVLNGDAIEEIAFLPGNYGVRYGRTLGGVVDLATRPTLPERSRGYVAVDTFQSTAFAEQRVGDGLAITVSGRRSYADVFLNPVLEGLSSGSIRVPRFFDLQGRLLGETRSGGTLDVLVLASDDRFRITGEDADGRESVQIGLSTTFQRTRLAWTEEVGEGVRNTLVAALGPERQEFAFEGGLAFERPFTASVREEVVRLAPSSGRGLGWRVGTDSQVGRYWFRYAVPGFGEPEGANLLRAAPSAYAEASVRRGAWLVTPGLRADGYFVGPGHRSAAVDPRVAARWSPTDTTALKASAGGYSQFPTVRQVVAAPELGPARSWQFSAGLEQSLGPDVGLELTGFANALTGLVSGREDAFRFFSGPPPGGPLDDGPYANDGVGSIVGGEALLRVASERTAAWVSATVSRSVRVDRPGGGRELFEYDQPLVLTALGSQELARGWRLGGRVRFASGSPYTPVVNRWFSVDDRAYVPVYGPEDSARLPAFWAIDARIDKAWTFRRWSFGLYLDVQNLTNRQNVDVMQWTYDFAEEDPIAGLPLVPTFGLRGEW